MSQVINPCSFRVDCSVAKTVNLDRNQINVISSLIILPFGRRSTNFSLSRENELRQLLSGNTRSLRIHISYKCKHKVSRTFSKISSVRWAPVVISIDRTYVYIHMPILIEVVWQKDLIDTLIWTLDLIYAVREDITIVFTYITIRIFLANCVFPGEEDLSVFFLSLLFRLCFFKLSLLWVSCVNSFNAAGYKRDRVEIWFSWSTSGSILDPSETHIFTRKGHKKIFSRFSNSVLKDPSQPPPFLIRSDVFPAVACLRRILLFRNYFSCPFVEPRLVMKFLLLRSWSKPRHGCGFEEYPKLFGICIETNITFHATELGAY